VTRTTILFGVSCALGLFACAEPAVTSGPPATRLDAMSIDGIPSGAVSGSLAGEDFTVAEARYRVENFAGRERVDLLLSDTALRRCGLPIVREGRMVWLRFDGVTELPTGEARVSTGAEAPTFSIHYEQRQTDERRYVGQEGGDALVAFDEATLGHITGKLFACFGDGQESCVKGSFTATPCFSRVDGRAIREGVGLEDEALEPQREGDGESAAAPTAGGGDTEGSMEPVPDRHSGSAAQEPQEAAE